MAMKAAVYHGVHDIRLEAVPDPTLRNENEALVRVTRSAICGSDLWFYRGVTKLEPGDRTGHQFVGYVEAVGREVRSIRPGDAVISPFAWSDGTCEFCQIGLQTACLNGGFFGPDGQNGCQAELVRVPYADGTLVRMPDAIAQDPVKQNASITLCDVMGTGHYGIVRAQTTPGSTVVIVGDGAVGLCAVLSAAKEVRAERVIAVGHNQKRLEVAKRFGATHTFDSHRSQAQDEIRELTSGGAAHVVEAVGNQESLELAVNVARPGGTVSFVGVPHNVSAAPIIQVFYGSLSLRGGPAPVRAYLPQLVASLEAGRIDPTPVLDLTLPLSAVSDGYAAMDERKALKVLLAVE
jgi:threonine dehydrogenase-like Zn-dependent dehydrogenase